MTEVRRSIKEFVDFTKSLKGDEIGEAQIFCDRLFQAFGHKGVTEAGGVLQARIRKPSTKSTCFADLLWKPHLLLEMKKRGENLFKHFQQAFDYWIHCVPNRPRYVVLCNFDEFRIYDFDKQIDQPVDVVHIEDLTQRYTALNFMRKEHPPPNFRKRPRGCI